MNATAYPRLEAMKEAKAQAEAAENGAVELARRAFEYQRRHTSREANAIREAFDRAAQAFADAKKAIEAEEKKVDALCEAEIRQGWAA